MNLILALIRRDLILSMRQGGGVGTALGFFLTVVVLLPIGIGPDQALLARIAPGALWISLLLSVLLSADRIFQQDYEDGSLDIMTMGPVPFEMVALAKAVAHWLSTSLPLAIAAPILGFLVNLEPAAILPLALAMMLGSIALSLLAAIGAAVTVGLRRGGLLVSILVGVILSVLGLDPFDILHSLERLARSIWNMGFDAFRWLWRYFLLGAVIVIPIWLIMRLVNAPRGR